MESAPFTPGVPRVTRSFDVGFRLYLLPGIVKERTAPLRTRASAGGLQPPAGETPAVPGEGDRLFCSPCFSFRLARKRAIVFIPSYRPPSLRAGIAPSGEPVPPCGDHVRLSVREPFPRRIVVGSRCAPPELWGASENLEGSSAFSGDEVEGVRRRPSPSERSQRDGGRRFRT